MPKTITIKGNGAMDEAQRAEALQYLQNEASTAELLKLKKLASDPQMRSLLKSF